MSHLRALLRKNWILFKRSLCCSCCEMLLPIIFAVLLVFIRSRIEKTDFPEKSYINEAETIPSFEQKTLFTKNSSTIRTIALSPNYWFTNELEKEFRKYGVKTIYFDKNEDLNNYIKYIDYGEEKYPKLDCGIIFTKNQTNSYEYMIRMNVSGPNAIIKTQSIPATQKYVDQDFINSNKYIDSGFLTIQMLIDNLIFKHESKGSNLLIQPLLTSMKTPKYVEDKLSDRLRGTAQAYIVFPWIVLFLNFLYKLLYEKERKIKEGMKMMGMTNRAFYQSWLITYGLMSLLSSLLTSLVFKVFFKNANWLLLFIWIWIFVLCLLAQSIFVSVFFTRPRSGVMAGLLFFFLQYYITQMVNSSTDVDISVKTAASLAPHAAMSFASDVFVTYEGLGVGLTFDTLNQESSDHYKVSTCIGMVIMNFFVYLILAIYLDQVVHNEFGSKKSPLFFLDFILKKKNKQIKPKLPQNSENDNSQLQLVVALEENISQNVKDDDITEPVDLTLKAQERNKSCLLVRNLNKTYSSGKKAVNQLNLTMYKGQIFVLLGHNGAGKTTTISILTGLLEATSGFANAFGLDIGTEMDQVRKFLGVCPQHDILFDQLTVKEHLELFATFKGVQKNDIQNEVMKMIHNLDIEDKTNVLSKNLSGGQKRKLSLGIAYIGDSKLILLDEPTSGMDTSARRSVWEMMKNNKNDRIVILTTHFMDEADYLGDRIAIMSSGELKCCGSSIFLKNKFGIGYNLIIVKKNMQKSPEINDFILSIVPNAKLLSDVSAEISFQLPLSSVPLFKDLFKTLDKDLNKLNILSYGISITTLEEVFLKVAEGDTLHRRGSFNANGKNKDNNLIDENGEYDVKSNKIDGCFSLFWIQINALILKRIRYFKRDIKGIIAEIFLPIIIVIIGLCLMLIRFDTDPNYRTISSDLYENKMRIIVAGTQQTNMLKYYNNEIDRHFHNSNNKTEWDEFLYKNKSMDLKGGYYFLSELNNASTFSYIIEINTIFVDAYPLLINLLNKAIIRYFLNNQNLEINIINAPFPSTKSEEDARKNIGGIFSVFIFSIGMSLIPASLIVYIVKEKQYNIKHQQLVSGASLFSYWTSNLIVDGIVILIPTTFSVLMCKAFTIESLTEDDCWGAVWLLFIFYGFAIINFSYLFAFCFNDYGSAQTLSFIMHFLLGGVGPIIFLILRFIDEKTERIGMGISYILRIIPSFSFGFGILNVSSRSLYASLHNEKFKRSAFDKEIAGVDIGYLISLSIIFFILIFVFEKLSVMPSFLHLISKEKKFPYKKKNYDSDVQAEREKMNIANPSNYAIMVNSLRKVYASNKDNFRVAVDSISFGVPNGECFGLLGVNGAGKTTTFKMLCGEVNPTAGEAYIAGYNLFKNLSKLRENIGYCPQFDALLDLLTTQEHLELFASLKGIPKHLQQNLIEKKISEMNLNPFKNICAGTYSGGNKRKLSVAMAMLGNPPIVFLDEPSTGMDPEARRFMWSVISRISTERKQSAIILTTHSMEEAEALSNRIAIMVNGIFQCLGSVQHIKNKFGKGYEFEVKTELPDEFEVNKALESVRKRKGERIRFNDLKDLLNKMNMEYLIEHIATGKSGAHIHHEINNPNGLPVEIIIEYVIIEKYGSNIINFISNKFGETNIIEHFQSFYRFKLNVNVSIGDLFSSFEENKKSLRISQYSIKQATIEQIFNMFANGQFSNDQNEIDKNLLRKNSSLSIFNK